jgi:hypothetical protein
MFADFGPDSLRVAIAQFNTPNSTKKARERKPVPIMKSKRRKRVAFMYTIDTIDDGLTRKKVSKNTDRILTSCCGNNFCSERHWA